MRAHHTDTHANRRHFGAAADGDHRAHDMAGHPTPAYQASAEPMHRPDHKAKKHSRPHRWEERAARRERQSREWGL